MYCEECGKKLLDGANFCDRCGAVVNYDEPAMKSDDSSLNNIPAGEQKYTEPWEMPDTQANKNANLQGSNKKGRSSKGAIAAVTIIAIAAVIAGAAFAAFKFGIISFGGNASGGLSSYEDVVKYYMDGMMSVNAEEIFNHVPQTAMEHEMSEEGYSADEKPELIAAFNEELQEASDYYEQRFGEGWTWSYEIDEEYNYSDYNLQNTIDAYGEVGVEVTDAKEADLSISFIRASGSESTYSTEVYLIQVGDLWYLDIYRMGLIS